MRRILSIFLLFAYSIGCSMDSSDDEGIGSLFPTPIIPEKNGSPGQDVNRDANNPPIAVEVFAEETIVEPPGAAEVVDNIAPQIVRSTVKHGDINVDVDRDHFVFTFSENIAGTNFIKLVDNTLRDGKMVVDITYIAIDSKGKEAVLRGTYNWGNQKGRLISLLKKDGRNWKIRAIDYTDGKFGKQIKNLVAAAHIFEEIAKISFKNDIQPMLAERCAVAGCHAAPGVAGLDLSKYDTFKKGGANGPAFVAGNGDGSLIVKRIDGGPPLDGDQVQLFIDWIDEGAENN